MSSSVEPPAVLLTLEEPDGEVPETRLQDAQAARQLVDKVIQEDRPRSQQRALVKGCVDGNAPYSEAKRKEAGLGWSANLNFGDARALMRSARTPYYQLFKNVKNYAVFQTNYDRHNPDRSRWEETVSQRFTCLLDRWKEFDWHMQAHQWQLLMEGYAPIVFDKDGDWRFKSIPANCVLVPKNTNSVLDDRVPFVVLRVPYRVHELYEFIKDEKSAEAVGWNVELVKQVIMSTSKSMFPNREWNTIPWEKWQQDFKSRDLTISYTQSDIVYCSYVFVREFSKDGNPPPITVGLVTENFDASEFKNAKDGFLYRKINKFENYQQGLIVFFSDSGDGFWHSQRGLAMECYKHVEVMNKLKCRVIDGAFIRSSIVLQPKTEKDQQKMQLAMVGVATYIPPGTEVVTGLLSGAIDEAMAVDRMLTTHLANNTGSYNQRSVGGREDGRGEARTAFEIQQQVAKEATLSDGQITLYYQQADSLYEEIYRRVMESSDPEAVRFRRLCQEDGVPLEAMKDMEYVRANRLAGYGSAQMKQVSNDQMMKVFSLLPEQGKKNLLNDYISSNTSPDRIERYNPPVQEITNDDWMAVMENAAVKDGEHPPVLSGQNPVTHLKIHIADLDEQLQPLADQIDQGQPLPPEQIQTAIQYLRIMLPHCQEHLQQLNNPYYKTIYQKFEADIKGAVGFSGKLFVELRKSQAAAQREQLQQDTATALDVVTQSKIKNEAIKTQTDIQRKDAKARADMALKTQKTLHSEQLQNFQVSAKNQREAADMLHSMRLDNMDKMNEMEANGSKEE